MAKNPGTNSDLDAFIQRVQQALYDQELSQSDLAERVGVSQPTVSDWLNRKSAPSKRNREKLMKALDLTEHDIEEVQPPPRPERSSDDVIFLPVMVRASAGNGYVNGELLEIEDYRAYSRFELRRMTGQNPERLRVMSVIGDSMEPEVRAGDVVVYLPMETMRDDGLYIFRMDDALKIKKLQRYTGGAIQIIPANPTYEKEMLLPLADADTPNMYRSRESGLVGFFQIVGKVVYYPRPA